MKKKKKNSFDCGFFVQLKKQNNKNCMNKHEHRTFPKRLRKHHQHTNKHSGIQLKKKLQVSTLRKKRKWKKTKHLRSQNQTAEQQNKRDDHPSMIIGDNNRITKTHVIGTNYQIERKHIKEEEKAKDLEGGALGTRESRHRIP